MGSDVAKAHEPYTVAPAGDAAPQQPDPSATTAPPGVADHLAIIDELAQTGEHTGSFLTDLQQHVTAGQQEIADAALDEDDTAHWRAQLAVHADGALAALPQQQLQQMAADAGFSHPTLVGVSDADSDGPPGALTFWLNPAYPSTHPAKAQIHAKADERYGQLAAGVHEQIHGQTLADVDAADAALHPHPGADPGETLTPAAVAGRLTELTTALTGLSTTGPVHGDGGLTAVLDAERRLLVADCPEMPDLATSKAAAVGLITKQLDDLTPQRRQTMIAQAVSDSDQLDGPQARWLDRTRQLALLRASTDPTVTTQLQQLAADRAAQVDALAAATDAVHDVGAHPHDADAIQQWGQTQAAAIAAHQQVRLWGSAAADPHGLHQAGLGQVANAATVTAAWRSWAKQQPLAVLKTHAAAMGMATGGAPRAQVQNWIAGSWDPAHPQDAIAAAVAAKHQPAPTPPDAATATATAAGAPTSVAAAPSSFAAKKAGVLAALAAHQAAAADIPAPQPPAALAALSFTRSGAAHVGGMHSKSFASDQHGATWLHKPDSSGGGRAHAEAAAATLHNRAGIRTPPVHVAAVDGKVGAIQPWIAGCSTLSGHPGDWSQADVDGIVRCHVAAWVTSNHDANPSNMLHTPSGALTPIDHGQAFRYFGADRLDVGYDPNGHSYGQPPPAYVSAYTAAAASGLAPGVTLRPAAAAPVISAFQAIPDAEFRAALADTARHGVTAKLPWTGPMRAAAQQRHGRTDITDAELADEFLDHAVARKQRLHTDFQTFFAGLGAAPAAAKAA